MKNIKELIYAAVEENAVVFQELAGNILQARAYDAIEALRPEIGASMFGESSHMNGKDKGDMDRDGKDEPDSEEYMDNKDAAIKKAMGKKVAEEFEQIDEEAKTTVDALKKVHGDHNFHVDKKGEIKHAYLNHSHVKKLVTALNTPGKGKGMIDRMMEEVEGLEEMSDDERRKELDRFGKKAAQTHGYDHPSDTSKASSSAVKSELKAARKLVAGTAKPYRSPTSPANEEVEQVNERTREETISQIKGLKKPAIKHGFDWPTDDSTDNVSTGDLKRFHKSARSVIKQGLKKDVQEVAMPQNQADMLARLMHSIEVKGHPVAKENQFKATHGKDTTKKASLEPGQDKLQYTIAQGGNVKP
jgi:uncharacterized protein YihD (DUF1040 family)